MCGSYRRYCCVQNVQTSDNGEYLDCRSLKSVIPGKLSCDNLAKGMHCKRTTKTVGTCTRIHFGIWSCISKKVVAL